MIQIVTTMIKTKFAFFQMQVKLIVANAVELLHSAFGKAPEAFDAVNMDTAIGKLVAGMIDAKMFLKTDINQSVIAAPFVRMNNNIGGNAAANNGLQSAFLAVGHNLGINPAVAFENAEDDRFARSTATTFATHPSGSEIRFIDFDLSGSNRSLARRFFGKSMAYFLKDRVNSFPRKISQFRCFAGGYVHRKITHYLTKFLLGNSGTAIIAV